MPQIPCVGKHTLSKPGCVNSGKQPGSSAGVPFPGWPSTLCKWCLVGFDCFWAVLFEVHARASHHLHISPHTHSRALICFDRLMCPLVFLHARCLRACLPVCQGPTSLPSVQLMHNGRAGILPLPIGLMFRIGVGQMPPHTDATTDAPTQMPPHSSAPKRGRAGGGALTPITSITVGSNQAPPSWCVNGFPAQVAPLVPRVKPSAVDS